MSGSRVLVVDSETLQPHPEALQFVLYLRGGSRSPNTTRAYTRAVATFLTWCERTGVPWRSASLAQLARFKTSLESTPTPTGRARSADTRAAVEDAGRELRKARAAAFIPLDQVRSRPHGR